MRGRCAPRVLTCRCRPRRSVGLGPINEDEAQHATCWPTRDLGDNTPKASRARSSRPWKRSTMTHEALSLDPPIGRWVLSGRDGRMTSSAGFHGRSRQPGPATGGHLRGDDDKPIGLNRVEVVFDDERVVSDAGVMLVATLAGRLGVELLAGDLVRLRPGRPGPANAGRKIMALVFAMILGADSIDDCGVLRAGRTGRLLGAGWRPRRLWGRSCGRSRSGTCGSSTRCSPGRSSGRGRPARECPTFCVWGRAGWLNANASRGFCR